MTIFLISILIILWCIAAEVVAIELIPYIRKDLSSLEQITCTIIVFLGSPFLLFSSIIGNELDNYFESGWDNHDNDDDDKFEC